MSTLPIVEVPDRIDVHAEPESIEEAEAERRRLVAILMYLDRQLGEIRDQRMADAPALRERVKRKRTIIIRRIQFVKAWIKQTNRDADTAYALLHAGEDFDDPAVLVARLRALLLPHASSLSSDGKAVLDAATKYLQTIARERVLEDPEAARVIAREVGPR